MTIKRFLIVIIITILSCESEKTDIIFQDVSYYIQKDYQKDIEILKQINIYLSQTTSNDISEVNSLINEYFNYIESLQENCLGEKNPFFEPGRRSDVSKKGKEFLQESSLFLKRLNSLTNNGIKERVDLLFNVDDIKYDDEWFIVYIDFYFRGVDCEDFKLLLDYRKRDLLIIQNQILYDNHIRNMSFKQEN